MRTLLTILAAVAVCGICASASAQNKLGANKEVRLTSGLVIYIEEKDNGIGPGQGWKRNLLNKVNWPSGFSSCATQHDIDYGTLGVSKNEADMKLKRCAAGVYSWTIGDLVKQQGASLQRWSAALGLFGITENMLFADVVYKLMQDSEGNRSYSTGQRMAQTTERYKREVEEALGMSVDTRRYYFLSAKL
jgi:hypothetical protein